MTLVSVLMSAYKPTYLAPAIRSALDQTHRDIEIVLLDDSPTREVRALIERFDDSRIRYLRNETSRGPALSHARAIAEASGSVVGILNDDDLWEPNLVERLLRCLEASPDAVVAFSDHWVMVNGKTDDEASDDCSHRWKRDTLEGGTHRPFQRLALLDKSIPLAVAALFRKDAISAGQIPPAVGGAYDFFLSYVLSRDGAGAIYVPERLAAWRVHGRNLTNEASCARAEEGAAVMRIMTADARLAALKPELTSAYGSALWSVATRNLRRGTRRRAVRAAIASARQGHLKALLLLPAAVVPRRLLIRAWP
jgi:glycosyltransferase involved in cell wall biosynthesis